jgi:hypothetical protein
MTGGRQALVTDGHISEKSDHKVTCDESRMTGEFTLSTSRPLMKKEKD